MGNIAVVGAGIAGLSCARELVSSGHSATIFEKSRSLGGRCASRLWRDHVVDHGAQYFTVRDDTFLAELKRVAPGRIHGIRAKIVDECLAPVPSRDARMYHQDGNNRIGKALAEGLDVRFENEVGPLAREGAVWRIGREAFDAVVATAPWPQSARLLGIHSQDNPYDWCLTAFFEYAMPFEGAAAERYAIRDRSGHPLAWSACENHKTGRVREGAIVIVVQADPTFSCEMFDQPPEAWTEQLRPMVEGVWELDGNAFRGRFAHRWRYSRRAAPSAIPKLPEGFFVAGDSRCESRIESVWLSGRDTAREVARFLGG